MIFTIRPPGWRSRAARIGGGFMKGCLFGVFAIFGAAVPCLLAMYLGRWVGMTVVTEQFLVLVAATMFVMIDLNLLSISLPHRNGQVAQATIVSHPWAGTMPYGFALGTGFWTHIETTLPYFLILLAGVSGSLTMTFSIAAGWALGRTLPILVGSLFSELDEGALATWLISRGLALARICSAGLIVGFCLHMVVNRNS